MTIGDFFDFNKAEYARRISFYDVNRLRKQEVVKIRQHTAAVCSITTGAAGALLSGGGTLLLSAYGARRLSVAHSKLELIQAELTKRGIALHEIQKRDILIPVGASIVGMGVGVGIDEAAAVATNTIPMEASVPPGSSLTDALSTNASGVISGVAHGVTEQTHEMGQAILNIDNGIPAAQDLARETIWAPAASTQDAIGFHAGMVIMQAVEKGFASLTSNLLATWTMEALTGDVSKTKPPLLPHHFPGTVGTDMMRNRESRAGSWLYNWIGNTVMSIIARLMKLLSTTVQQASERCLYLSTGAEYGGRGVPLKDGQERALKSNRTTSGSLFSIDERLEPIWNDKVLGELQEKQAPEIVWRWTEGILKLYQ
ncbi:hypothetical protein FOBRF1_001746 [Fusarium oxysporum]